MENNYKQQRYRKNVTYAMMLMDAEIAHKNLFLLYKEDKHKIKNKSP